MPDDRAKIAEKPHGIEVQPTVAPSHSPGGASRSPALIGVAAVLTVALAAGGIMVARTFMKPTAVAGSSTPAVTLNKSRGAEAIEAAIASAQHYANNREYPKAEAILTRAVEEFPTDQPLRLELARTLVAEQKFAAAYPHYEAAIALGIPSTGESASAPASRAQRVVGDPKLHFEAGTIASKAGLLDRAEEHYSMAQTGDMTDPRYPLFLGMVQLRLNREDAAQASLIRSVTLDAGQAPAWGTLGELSLKKNQLSLAIQHIEKARKLDPDTPRWRLTEAKARKRRSEQGDVEMAAQLLLAMDKSEQLRPDAVGVLAECYGLLHRPKDAATLYADAARIDPKNSELAYQAGAWFQRAGDVPSALRYAKVAAMLGNEPAQALVKELDSASSK